MSFRHNIPKRPQEQSFQDILTNFDVPRRYYLEKIWPILKTCPAPKQDEDSITVTIQGRISHTPEIRFNNKTQKFESI